MVANRNNYALEFNGSSSYVALSDSYNNNNLTVESYIKIRNLASENYTGIVTNVETSGYGLIVDNTAKKLGARIYVNNSYYYAYADQLVETNRWYHLAMTYDGKVLKLYVDGILQSSPTNIVGTIKNSSVKMAIGCNPGTTNAEFFNGWIDEVRIWSRALDASEIAENMNKILTGTENGLVGYFRFEEGNGNIAYDLSSRKLNGTINLSTWVNGEIDLYLKPNKTLLQSNNRAYSIIDEKLISLSNYSEEDFLNYGLDEVSSLTNKINQIKTVEKNASSLDSGKTFEHAIDLSERRVDKIILN